MRIIAIEASNMIEGGGPPHLSEILSQCNPSKHKFDKIIIWAPKNTLKRIEDLDWIDKRTHELLNKSLLFRLIWRLLIFPQELKKSNYSLLFVPGGSDSTKFSPMVSMCQNMLPFETNEAIRFGVGFYFLKFKILKKVQLNTFIRSKGVIFLSNYAKKVIYNQTHSIKKSIIIPHGINKRFYRHPNPQKSIFTKKNPCKVIYVSKTDPYKHHINLVKALKILLDKSLPIELILIGPKGSSHNKLIKNIANINLEYDSISLLGNIPYEKLNEYYSKSDIAVFASSCENLPNILLESMASGLPIASSNKGPMPEILNGNAMYFNPESIKEIADALEKLVKSPELRADLALKSYKTALSYSWNNCTDETFKFFDQIIESQT